MTSLFKKPSAPATPDYAGLAQQQGAENRRSAETTARLGSPNEVTPWGQISREFDPTSGQFTYTTSLTPEQQRLFEGQQDIDLSLMDVGKKQIGNLSDVWGQPFDTSGFTERKTSIGDFAGDRDKVEDALYQRQLKNLDPQYQQSEEALRSRLYNQGIREGHPAWEQAISNFDRQKTGDYENARLASITGAGEEQSRLVNQELERALLANTSRGAELDEAAYLRSLPFNELSAILQGTAVNQPQFSGPTVAPGVQGAPIYQAGQDRYQADYNRYAQEMARLNSMWNTVGQVGAQLGGAAMAASDRRLKRNIRRIGSLRSGLSVYEYEIFGRPEVGVMAQEARELFPDSVSEHPIGYLQVDYARIG